MDAAPERLQDVTLAERLLPCPFCGNAPKAGWQGVDVPGMEDCGYYGIDCCQAFSHADDEESAVAAWNKREAAAALSVRGDDQFVRLTRTELRQLSADLQTAAITQGQLGLRATCIETSKRVHAMLSATPPSEG